ncbi:hypothetical protein ASE01_20175 [Nocardioides sp. Root190]|uniref:helix-turn-helix domain-containing protein n=1 Tax=Nocardioides sp. Root190 TaxID=1736488 RepID=UPI0006FC93ED|nr:helix-turn-helix domain-containing protein [Nocardioides sp. Root190]KRB73095.1 hypothetical protein ASE01_20175 [Nocardioides sp. Root190]
MKLLSITEAADMLSCSRGHVYNLVAAGEFRVVDIGIAGRSKTRLPQEDVEAYVLRRLRTVGRGD